jgi:hypothetical protein
VELHRERELLPKPVKVPKNAGAAIALVRATITDRITSGALKAGQTLKQIELANELGVHGDDHQDRHLAGRSRPGGLRARRP